MKPRLRLLLFGPVLCASLIATLPQTSQSAVFERDWKTPGDGLLTYDDVNGREWLDLSETLLEKFSGNPGNSIFDTEDEYQNVIAELAPRGLFEGFDVAKSAGLIAFAQSAGIDTAAFDLPTNEKATQKLISLLGESFSVTGISLAIGYLDQFNLPPPARCPCRVGSLFSVDEANDIAGLAITSSTDHLRVPRTSVMLYRSIPEPSSAVIAGWGIAVCLLSPRVWKKRN